MSRRLRVIENSSQLIWAVVARMPLERLHQLIPNAKRVELMSP